MLLLPVHLQVLLCSDKNMIKNKVLLGTLAAFAANLIFGFSFMFSKIATENVHPLVYLSLRFTLAFLVLNLLLLLKIGKLKLKGKALLPPVILGICQPLLYMILEVYGIKYTSSAVSGVIIAFVPTIVLIFSGLFLKEKAGFLQYIFAGISIFGILIISLFSQSTGKTYLSGIIILIGAVICAVAYNLINEKIADSYSPFERTYITFFVSALGFNLISPFVVGQGYFSSLISAFSGFEFVISLLYLSLLSSVGAFLLYNFALSNISVIKASSFSNIIPIVSILAGVFILNEKLTITQLIGCVLIIIGVYGVNKFKTVKKES